MKNKINDLRDHLFATLEALQDVDNPMDVDRARAISEVAGTIVASAKVEVDYIKVTGALHGSGFIPTSVMDQVPQPTARVALPTRH